MEPVGGDYCFYFVQIMLLLKILKIKIIIIQSAFIFSVSLKYYRDVDGFIYKRSGKNQTTMYFDCLTEPDCIAGARVNKKTNEVVHFSDHSDKPDENLFF